MSQNYDVWKELEEYFQENPRERTESVPEEEIDLAEKQMGLKFSEGYRKYLSLHGGGGLGCDVIHGLRYHDDMDERTYSVIDKTKFYRNQGWPDIDDWYVISDDGFGNPIGIDPEGKVWLSDHDSGFELVKLGDSFEEFIHRLLTDTLYQ